MLTSLQVEFLQKAYQAAKQSGHIYPGAAAAECALESAWGTSKLCLRANNLFGMKKASNWTGPTINIVTQEFLDGIWKTVPATWEVFGSWAECLTERMKTLTENPRYAKALGAMTPEDFVIEVSQVWATDPERAVNVLSIYHHHLDILRD